MSLRTYLVHFAHLPYHVESTSLDMDGASRSTSGGGGGGGKENSSAPQQESKVIKISIKTLDSKVIHVSISKEVCIPLFHITVISMIRFTHMICCRKRCWS